MTKLNRRHLLTILGAGLTIAPPAFATSLSQDIAQRLAQAQQDGKADNLHTLLVSQGGKLVFEYYGQGEDEAEGRGALRTVVFGPDVPHDLRSVAGTRPHAPKPTPTITLANGEVGWFAGLPHLPGLGCAHFQSGH